MAAGPRAVALTAGDARALRDRFDGTNPQLLFSGNPQPMYIYDAKTLAFLDVNEAALAQYGYAREELLRMCITDIRPVEDIPRVLEAVRNNPSALDGLISYIQMMWHGPRRPGTMHTSLVNRMRLNIGTRMGTTGTIAGS